jgi:CelD/BcsL family acetyltransferase involved in cellulose biosynthesis
MNNTVFECSLAELKDYRRDTSLKLNWFSPFILPEWMQVWLGVFGEGERLYIRVAKQGDNIIGIAPLMVKDGGACFIGNTDVCDYQDFITAPGMERDFFNALLDDLKASGIRQLDLKHVRPDSAVLTQLVPAGESRNHKVVSEKEAVSFEMALPPTFEAYLETLTTKQRHEVRRKMRRLTEEGNIEYRFIQKGTELTSAVETFFKMFVESRQDKAAFLTGQMREYFRRLIDATADLGILRLGVLELDKKPVAEIMCFDYNDCIYLYNSGYDPQYVGLSAGLLSKVYAIKDSIEKGKKRFDFLKGAEVYKGHLGGKEVPLYRCRIEL